MSHDSHGHGGDAVGFHAPHVVPSMLFFKVLVALLFLTFITVAVSRVDFGSANMLVAMGIASVKAALVMTFFMHLKWDTPINNIAILSSFLFLSLLFIFTLADISTRSATDPALNEVAPVLDYRERWGLLEH
ncbi:MAG: cytochrome C oxidase subunit IV family protein [Planctomycetota bacterium]